MATAEINCFFFSVFHEYLLAFWAENEWWVLQNSSSEQETSHFVTLLFAWNPLENSVLKSRYSFVMHRRKYEEEIFKMPWYWKMEPRTLLLFPLWHGLPATGVPSRADSLLTALIPWELVNFMEWQKWKPAKDICISPQKTKSPLPPLGVLWKSSEWPHPEENSAQSRSDPWHSPDHEGWSIILCGQYLGTRRLYFQWAWKAKVKPSSQAHTSCRINLCWDSKSPPGTPFFPQGSGHRLSPRWDLRWCSPRTG